MLLSLILVFPSRAIFAQVEMNTETVQSRNLAPESPTLYGPYLNCLNKLRGPIRLTDVNSSNPGEPSENPTLFRYNYKGQSGFFFLNPNQAHFATTNPYQSEYGYTVNSLLYIAPSGKKQLINEFAHPTEDFPMYTLSYEQDKIAQRLPNIAHTKLAEQNQRISRPDGLSIIEPAGENFIKELPKFYQMMLESIEFHANKSGNRFLKSDTERLQNKIRDALCSCMKTQNTRLMQAVREVAASSFKFIEDPEECASSPMVSSNGVDLLLWRYIISSASADEPKKILAEVRPKWLPTGLYKEKEVLTICGTDKSMTVSFVNFGIIRQSGKCTAGLLKSSSKVITNKLIKAEVIDQKVVFTKL